MSADVNLVEKAAEAVKKMQELEVGQSYYDFMFQYVETPDDSTREQAGKDAENNAEILTGQAEELVAFYKKIDTSIFMKFPESWLEGVANQAAKHHELITNPSRHYIQGMTHDKIVWPLNNAHHKFFQMITPMLGAMMMLDNDYQKSKDAARIFSIEKEEFSTLKNSMIKQHESWENDNVELKAAIDGILQSARGASAEAGAAEQASFFDKQGKEHETKQKNWLWASVSVTVVLLGYLIGSYYFSSLPDEWKPIAISQVVIKACGFSLLLFVLIFCVKNYKAHGHNHIVNIHRAKSLQTYGAIVHAAKSPDIQDIILANAAQHIFMPLDTGYVKGADSVGNPTMEIIRSGVKLVDGKE